MLSDSLNKLNMFSSISRSNSSNLINDSSNFLNQKPIKFRNRNFNSSLNNYLNQSNTLSNNSLSSSNQINFISNSNSNANQKRITNIQNSIKIKSSISKNTNSISNQINTSNNIIKTNKKNSTNKKSLIGHITTTALKKSSYNSQEYTLSIIENYAREVGITAFNFRTTEFFITQFIDNEAYIDTITMINYWSPLEIVMNQKAENSSLHLIIKNMFPKIYIGFQPRKNFNEDFGKSIYSISVIKDLSINEIGTKYVCLASLSGLIKYLENNPDYISIDSYYIHYHYLENHLNISFNSTIDLELLMNKKDQKIYGSLYSLFKCKTISGNRLLRSNILQPFALEKDIVKRNDCVSELVKNNNLLLYIKENISLFRDLEINISKLMHKINKIESNNNVLKSILEAIQGIKNCLQLLPIFNDNLKNYFFNNNNEKNENNQCELLKEIINFFDNNIFKDMSLYIDKYINDYSSQFAFDDKEKNNKLFQKNDFIFFLVREGINNVLDVSRKTYLDTLSQIYSEFERIKQNSNDPTIKLCYSENKGYYISINEKYFINNEFTLYKKINKRYACSNNFLISFSQRIKEIKCDLVENSVKNCENIISLLKKNINYLYILSNYIANLDVICAFADYAISFGKLNKPKISSNNKFNFIYGINCRHPLLEKYIMENLIDINNKPLVANDYFLINHFNLLLLKGPNSSGKTTFMKELALIIILAQIGSFIPCDYFCFTVRKFIYCKFDSNESIIENKGSFISQIIDIQKMIKNHSNQSLILLDEPFDNTYSIDVFSIAISFLDLFSKNFDTSFIIISSHNDIISNLSQFYFNSFIGSMIVEFEKNENIDLNFLYKFKLNSFFQINNNKDDDYEQNYNNYGIILCDMIQMKKEIMDNAKQCQKNNVFEQEQIFDSSKEVNTLKIVLIKLFKYIFDIICIKETFTLEEEISIKIEKLKNFISNTFN